MKVLGSSKIETTKSNDTELVAYKGPNDEYTKPSAFRTLSFAAMTQCTVKINDSESIFIPAGASLEFEQEKISSFIINETGVKYIWMATI